MTADPDTVEPTATIGMAAAMMVHGGYRHVPIVDGGKLVGIVSIRDLLAAALRDARRRVGEARAGEARPRPPQVGLAA